MNIKNLPEIKLKISQVLLSHLPKLTVEELSDNVELFSLGLNSLNTVQLVLALEETFGFEFEMYEFIYESFRTLADITEVVKNKIEE